MTWVVRLKEKLAAYNAAVGEDARKPNAPIDGKTLESLEGEWKLRLPEDYAAVLRAIGNGGFGPDYGLAPLTLETGSGMPKGADPSRPFLLRERFDVLDAKGNRRRFPIPEGASPHDGAVMLTDIGCGYLTFLVVNGEKRGEVWADYTEAMEDAVIAPVAKSFREWFEGWLDDALRSVIEGSVHEALERGEGVRSPDHALIEKYESLVVADPDSVLITIARIEVDLYLGRRSEAAALLASAEKTRPGDPSLSAVRRFVLRDDFAAAERGDPDAIARSATHTEADVRLAVAMNPNVPADVLVALANDPSPAVRTAVARHGAAPQSTLGDVLSAAFSRWLDDASDTLLFELEGVLRNAHSPAPTSLIEALRDDPSAPPLTPWLLRAAVLHRDVDPSALVTHPSALLRHAAALHPALSVEGVIMLASDPEILVRLTIATRHDLPRLVFEKLAGDESGMVKTKIARHPSTPVDLLVRMTADVKQDVVYALSCAERLPDYARAVLELHPMYIKPEPQFANVDFDIWPRSGPAGVFRYLALGGPSADAMKMCLFSHPAAPLPLLPPHIEMQYGMGGYNMAEHPLLFTDPKLTQKLVEHPYAYTRKIVAERRDLPPAIRDVLARDPQPMVRAAIAARHDIDHALYEELANDPVAEVRSGAASSVLITQRIAEELAKDEEKWVRRDVLRNPLTPHTIVDELARDPEADVRKWAAERRLSPETLERLTKDADEGVRKWATWRRRTNDLLDAARTS